MANENIAMNIPPFLVGPLPKYRVKIPTTNRKTTSESTRVPTKDWIVRSNTSVNFHVKFNSDVVHQFYQVSEKEVKSRNYL